MTLLCFSADGKRRGGLLRSEEAQQGHVAGKHDAADHEQLGHVAGDVSVHTAGHEQHRQRFNDERRPVYLQQRQK